MAFNWFRMYHEFATDPKVQSMSEPMQRRLVMLFCIRCRDGYVSFQEDELAVALGIPFGKEFTETKELFIRKGFIDDHWTVLHWDKRQYKSDTSADRTRLWRESRKAVTSQDRHGDGISSVSVITSTSIPRDTEVKPSQKRHRDVTEKTTVFRKPSTEDVRSYCTERSNGVDPVKFFNYYESNGWMVGKNKMKNWKAAVHTWEANSGFGNGAKELTAEQVAAKMKEWGYDEK
jgi:hypothetical protein